MLLVVSRLQFVEFALCKVAKAKLHGQCQDWHVCMQICLRRRVFSELTAQGLVIMDDYSNLLAENILAAHNNART